MTRDELVAAIRRDRAALDAVAARVPEGRLTEAVLDDGWSVKDALAHIAAWEQLCLKWVREDKREEGPFDEASINAFNRRLYEGRGDFGLAEVLEESARSAAEMLAAVEVLTEDALSAPPRWGQATLGQIISSNADEHYREHIEQIGRWLAGGGR